jgi:hypothetical protein
MIKNPQLIEQAELEYERRYLLTLEEKFGLLEEMYQLALELGRFPQHQLDDESDDTLSLAKALHGKIRTAFGTHRRGA